MILLNAVLSHAAISSTDQAQETSCIAPETNTLQQSDQSPLALARNLRPPSATDTQDAEFEHASFWDDHGSLIQDAWKEWEEDLETGFPLKSSEGSDHGFINPTLSRTLNDAFGNPSKETESAVKSIWTTSNEEQTLPKGVYATQLLTPSGIAHIRNLLDMATSSGIPTRRPNGMNRHGVIVDPNVYGAVSMKSLVKLVEEEVINRVVRPVGRMLFPDRVGCNDDVDYFAFTIRYDGSDDEADGTRSNENVEESVQNDGVNTPKRDFELKEHRDASIVTLNINLNLPEEGYAGSQVYFREFPSEEESTTTMSTTDNEQQDISSPDEGSKKDGGTVRFSPGMAIIHLGAHRHGSLPISTSTSKNGSGKRYNLVIWLFGKDGYVRIAPYAEEEQMNILDRWHGCNHTQGLGFDQEL
eukprot:CAMPEP_0172302882 /NCGR_PEP_ID=MMETSP1058-20130122/4526_1 /TAXON_ID=83371 /ORGANISM="Detonula confervacea, Strain CCMP 353" /LENGTH=413 /DNA_ID=CAMNT_0013013535 /DNA_START=147 /DNA_END=1388 /DNA_ORIENTATION=+